MHAGFFVVTGLLLSAGQHFPLGVAAGDVTDTAAVLWTRTDAPGMIRWHIAEDDSFAILVASGESQATADADLTVHVDASGLQPGRSYFYRFVRADAADAPSAVGQFRTTPSPNDAQPLRFAISGDSDASHAPFHVLGFAAQEDLDFFLFIGDTIYADIPAGDLGIATTLDEYRAKYHQNWSDPFMQQLFQATPIWAAWDDHEVADNYSGVAFLAEGKTAQLQLDAAYQAFFENIPIRPAEERFRIYRSFRFGRTAEFFLVDGRQYRDPEAAEACENQADPFGLALGGLKADPACIAVLSEPRTMLGAAQLQWLEQGLLASAATVKFVVLDVPIMFIGLEPYDDWDGYDFERREILEFIAANRIENVYFLATDTHANVYNPDVTEYFRRNRPDYALGDGVACPGLIVGPIATATLHDGVVDVVAGVLGLDPGSLAAQVLAGTAEQGLADRLTALEGLSYINTNQFAYAVIDVQPDGSVRTQYRGLTTCPLTGETQIATIHEEPPPSLPCALPLLGAIGVTWLAAHSVNRRCAARPLRDRTAAEGGAGWVILPLQRRVHPPAARPRAIATGGSACGFAAERPTLLVRESQ
jgi:alkaline phosphatase D